MKKYYIYIYIKIKKINFPICILQNLYVTVANNLQKTTKRNKTKQKEKKTNERTNKSERKTNTPFFILLFNFGLSSRSFVRYQKSC